MSRPRNWPLILLIGTFVLLASVYSLLVPAFETPDEIWHQAFIQHLAQGRGLPVSGPDVQALWQQQGVQAPGYYLAAAGLTSWIDQSDFPAIYARANPHAAIGRADATDNRNYLIHHPDEELPWRGSILALHVARLFSVFLGAVTLWATYRTLVLLLGASAALLSTALVGFIPQFIFISAAASNDNAINALAALVLWRLVALVVQPPATWWPGDDPDRSGWPRWLPFLGLGCLLGLALLAKLSALGLVALAGLALLLAAWRARSWRLLLGGGLAVALPAVLVGGWWYVRNWLLYGDPLAWNVWQANILLRVVPAGWATVVAELESLERSFWGLFGWLNVAYPGWVYAAFRGVEIVVAVGLLVGAVTWLVRSRRVNWRWAGGALLVLWLLLLTISWLRFMRIAPAAQGRYFFPAAPTVGLLMVLGFGSLVPGLVRRQRSTTADVRAYPASPLGATVASGLLLLSAVTPFWIIRAAYQPPPERPEMAVATTSLHADLGGQFAILGAGAEPAELAPGQEARVTVAWQALAPSDVDYSVFVHLVDDDGLTIAQADTMPGGGLLPTSRWQPGQSRVETYVVTLPATAYTPDQGHWAVGLYDHRTGRRLPVSLEEGAAVPAGVSVAADSLRFGDVTISPPPGQVPNALGADFLDNVTLMGYSLSSRRLTPGDPLTVTLYWQARGPVEQSYTTFAHLLDASGQTRGGHDGVPQPPTTGWQPGEAVTDVHTFSVAADAPPGIYQVEVGLYTWPDLDRLSLVQSAAAEGADRLLLGQLQVATAP